MKLKELKDLLNQEYIENHLEDDIEIKIILLLYKTQ